MVDVNQILEIIATVGVVFFAISGALTAMERKFDVFGVFIIAFATSVGGGSLRDVILPERDVFWLINPIYTYGVIFGTVVAVLFRKRLNHFRLTLSLFDTIGLGLYTVVGVQIAMQFNLPGISSIALGVITGSFGGVLRDILVNEVPLIFRKEIYATISIFGGSVYYFAQLYIPSAYGGAWIEILAILIIIILRLLVVTYEVSLPSIYSKST